MDLVAVTNIDAAFAQLRERLTHGAEGFEVRLMTPEGARPRSRVVARARGYLGYCGT